MNIFKKNLPTIKQLRCFLAVAQELNFHRAARLLNISQPPLTRHIQALEHILENALFIRDTHSVQLTEAGRQLEAHAYLFLTQLGHSIDAMKTPANLVTLGITRILNIYALETMTSLLESEALRPDSLWHHLGSSQLLRALDHHQLDLIIAARPPSDRHDLCTQKVHTETMLMALPLTHIGQQQHNFDFDEPTKLPLFWFQRQLNPAYHDQCDAFLKRLPHPPIRIPEPEDSLIMLAQVAQGKGMALMTLSMSCLMQQGLSYRPFHPKHRGIFDLDLYLTYRAKEENPKVLALANQLKAAFQSDDVDETLASNPKAFPTTDLNAHDRL